MRPIRVGIIGLGKIAREEHIPALRSDGAFELVACASTRHTLADVPIYPNIQEMLKSTSGIDAVAICTPPQSHYEAARFALEQGKHVLLEKPPCPTLEQFEELIELARLGARTLFQTWHAREAVAVTEATRWLAPRKILAGRVVWKEDVRHWHPGQNWIWDDGGFGVLDAGINAISILTKIAPETMVVESAHMWVPANCACPIAAAVSFRTESGALIDAEFDFRHQGIQMRSVELQTDAGPFDLARCGAEQGPEHAWGNSQSREYVSIYRRFAELIDNGLSDTDRRPLELVLDIFKMAGRSTVAPFRE